ncbi:sulfite oxidase-like [Varroa jacobsoni]|uniref:sulfite oxidase-like n=1 Tax=Varroa jacobsoni TaxID=62625 RepID=UPI000BFA700B|nr:sulfite oxidase-like [Varroa jacobsoni]
MSTAAIYWWGVMSQGARVARQRLPIGRCYGWSGPICIRAHHYSGRRSHCEHTAENHGGKRLWALGLSGVVLGGTLYAHYRRRPLVAATYSKRVPGERVFGYKEYSVAEVAKHVTKEDRVWVTFRDGVYDITDFIDKHPGGENILLGAGGAVDPFWDIYGVHKKKEILDLLEEYRIGNLEETRSSLETINDPYDSDPPRHKALKPASLKPFNAEPPLQILADDFHTPNSLFYVRNHLPVPLIDPSEYKLEIEGIGIKGTKELTLDELKTKFPKVTITATLQCAGNRRSEQNKIKKVKGLDWGAAAIGNATWSGARLTDVLQYLGVDLHDPRINHVIFDGLDLDPTGKAYGASVTARRALNPDSDVILAYEMNGEVLSRDHGFPVRVVVPGVVGARNVKWLGRIALSEVESDSHWQQNDYKGFCPSVDWDTVDFKSAPAIEELPVISSICDPLDGTQAQVIDGKIHFRGYAWSGGGRKIVRVDVSADGGKTWQTADLVKQEKALPLYRTWSWTLWEANITVKPDQKFAELVCKAVDSSYNSQPDTVEPLWNLRGVLNNSWSRARVQLTHK